MTSQSTFAERFEFSRDRQRIYGRWEPDQDLAAHLGRKPSAITEYKGREEAPAAAITLALARRLDVDPGWLAFGAETAAPAPPEFQGWLAGRRGREQDELRRKREIVHRGQPRKRRKSKEA